MKTLQQILVEQSYSTKTQKEIIDMFKANEADVETYQKFGKFDARKAIDGERITTTINGETETTNVAKLGDVVVRGPEGEQYIISDAKFKDRYKVDKPLTKDFQKYEATGKINAFKYIGKPFKFIASWGEEMICNDGDYLAAPFSNDGTVKEVYRIEENVFNKTYKLNKV